MEGAYQYGTWVFVGIVIYMIGMLYIGYWASKRVRTTPDFIVAGRRLGLGLATATLFATWFGAGTCMGGAGNAYIFGIQGVIFDPWGAALCLILAGFFFARMMRRGRYISLVDFFELRYGKGMGVLSTLALAVAEMGWVGAQLVAFGTIIHYFAGAPLWVGILIATVVLVIYTYLGGMWSVTLTDFIQMILLTVGMIVILAVAVPLVGGWGKIFTNSPDLNMMGIFQWDFLPTSAAKGAAAENAGYFYYTGYVGWFYYFAAWMAIGLGSIPAQDFMQRMLSSKNERVAVRSSYIAGLGYITVGMMPVIIGMVYFQLNPDLSIEDAMNKILLFMATEHLAPILAIIFVCALVAALMSSSDSAILAASTVIGYNGLKFFKPDASDKETLRTTRICVPIITGISLVLALYFEVIYNLMVISWSVLLIGLFAPYAAGYFWKKANRTGAIAAFVGGFVVWIIGYFAYLPMTKEANFDCIPGYEGVVYFDYAMWDSLYIASIWAFAASIVCLIVFSLATQKKDPPREVTDVDGKPMKVVNWAGIFGKGEGNG